jgi:hypothetical protein
VYSVKLNNGGVNLRNKEFLRKVYKRFSDFVAVAASRELDFLILDAKYTTAFSYRLKQILGEIKESGNPMAELSVFFNTDGDIALIDADLVGNFVGDSYCVGMEENYKNASLNKIVKSVINNSSEKVQQDFVLISYKVLYNTLDQLYMEVKCRKEVLSQYKQMYNVYCYEYEDASVVIASLLVLEDICRYIGISNDKIMNLVENTICKK